MDTVLRVTKTKARCSMNEKRKRPKYTKEFREYAVKMVTEQGYSSNEAGQRSGISQSNISRWVCEYRRDQEDMADGGVTHKELELKIWRVEKENRRLETERKILKKAAAFFAKKSQ
jgi:transposase